MPENLIAATLDYAFDHARIASEIRACEEFFNDSPPHYRHVEAGLSGKIPFMSESPENYRRIDSYDKRGINRKQLRGVNIFYLRKSTEHDVTRDPRFSVTKTLSHRSWRWRPELERRIPYTIECIESLPYKTLGMVRAFVCENTFMPTHRDTEPGADQSYDRAKAVGISLIPATGGVGMLIWNPSERHAREVRGHCILFDDACWHGVPMTRGLRITLRIFGELELDKLAARMTGCVSS